MRDFPCNYQGGKGCSPPRLFYSNLHGLDLIAASSTSGRRAELDQLLGPDSVAVGADAAVVHERPTAARLLIASCSID